MADDAIINTAVSSAPKDYTLTGVQELLLKAVRANIDGTAAASAYFPALQMLAPDGTVMWTAISSTGRAAGASVSASWFPGLRGSGGGGGTGGGNKSLKVALDTPDSSGNAFPWLTTRQGFSTVRRVL